MMRYMYIVYGCILDKEMATHSSILAWRIPGTGEPGGLPSMGSHRVGHDCSDLAFVHGYIAIETNKTCHLQNMDGPRVCNAREISQTTV